MRDQSDSLASVDGVKSKAEFFDLRRIRRSFILPLPKEGLPVLASGAGDWTLARRDRSHHRARSTNAAGMCVWVLPCRTCRVWACVKPVGRD